MIRTTSGSTFEQEEKQEERGSRETLGVSIGKKMRKVSLKNFNKISNHDLIRLFKYVNNRNHSLIDEIELKEFKDKTNTWCLNSNAEFFGIFNNNDFVGTISLSKQNMKEKRACIGYEIFPSFRKKGFASNAFKLILKMANNKKFLNLNATIQKENKASIKIWENEGAVFNELKSNKIKATLNLNNWLSLKNSCDL